MEEGETENHVYIITVLCSIGTWYRYYFTVDFICPFEPLQLILRQRAVSQHYNLVIFWCCTFIIAFRVLLVIGNERRILVYHACLTDCYGGCVYCSYQVVRKRQPKKFFTSPRVLILWDIFLMLRLRISKNLV